MSEASVGIILVAFFVYLLMMIIIGAMCMKQNNNTEDYFLGGRNLGGFVAALSAQASDMSGWLLMGLPGSIYLMGTGQAWIGIGLFIGTTANWIFVAGRLRKYTIRANNSLTLPEFFMNRYKDDKKILLGASSLVIVIFFLVYTASALASGGKLFNSIFGIDYHTALVIGALVILVYTFMGGFLAVCTTDFIQGMLMLLALLLIPIIAYFSISSRGVSALLGSTGVDPVSFMNIMQENGETIKPVSIISSLAWGLGYFGMPHILIRFMAVKDDKELAKSKVVAITWVFLSLLCACIIGVIGRAYLAPMVLGTDGNVSSESVFIEMIKKIFVMDLHIPFVAGIFLCAILAAIMSTADSQLLVASSAVSEDLYKGLFKKDADELSVLKLSRISVVVVALLAIVIAWNPESSIMALVSDAWAGFGAAFGPLVLMSLYWKRTNLQGAFAGIVSGALTVIIWDYIPLISGSTPSEATGLYSLVPGFIISLLLIIIVSMATPEPEKDIVEAFEDVSRKPVK
ncbi:MAG: sodium/proline symporter PutP [Lachnospiraceae bacterium]|nr:sodium/proline symporter PutP [Lachnospiraceae bacterium]